MSNVNTFADVILHQNNGQPLVLSFPTTGHQSFALGAGVALLNIPNPLALIDSGQPFPGRAAQGIPILLRACGLITAGRGVGYQIDINQGTGLSPAIFTTGSQTTPLGAGLYNDNWFLEVPCLWDGVSLNLRGIGYGWAGGTAVAQTALVGSSPATLAALQFNVGVTVLNTNAANSFTLTEFSAELT